MRSWCVLVPLARGEEVRRRLRDEGLLAKRLKVHREGDTLCVPTVRRADVGMPTDQREFEEAFVAVRSYKDLVRVPESVRPQLPNSFDVIGDIAVVKIPEPLLPFRREIGEAFLRWDRRLRVVAQDHGVEGDLRVRRLERIAGEDRTETSHVEHGLRYRVDVARAYFSPRLGTERRRIADLVAPGEVVADPFAGVGPYAILIAKRRSPARVYASDANPVAVRYLEANVALNRADKVVVGESDARDALRRAAPTDRVILDLPHSARDFLPDALTALGPRGTIHLYAIVDRADLPDVLREIRAAVRKAKRRVTQLDQGVVRAYSPTMDHVVFDVRIGPGSRRAALGTSRSAARRSPKRRTPGSRTRSGRSARRRGPRGPRRRR